MRSLLVYNNDVISLDLTYLVLRTLTKILVIPCKRVFSDQQLHNSPNLPNVRFCEEASG
jgi:hypothetical protein